MTDLSKPTIPEVIDRFRAYVSLPGNEVGGSLHIVIEDVNIEDGHVAFCREYARDQGDVEGFELAEILLRMSKTQRSKIARTCWYHPDGKLITNTDPFPRNDTPAPEPSAPVPVGTATMLRDLVDVLRATDAGFEMLADMLNVIPAKTSKAQSDLLMMASWLEDHPDIDAAMLTVITAADVDGG